MKKQTLKDVLKKQAIILGIWILGVIAGASAVNWHYLLPTLENQIVFEQRGCVSCDTIEESKPEMAEDNLSGGGVAIKPKAQEESTRLEADSHSVNLIKETFPEDKEVAVAIAKAESRLNPKAKGYNCRYNGISQACKAGDQGKAWSVDCGLMQINTLGQDCPEELMEVEHNLKVAKQIKDEGGWKRWWTFKTNKHLAFL